MAEKDQCKDQYQTEKLLRRIGMKFLVRRIALIAGEIIVMAALMLIVLMIGLHHGEKIGLEKGTKAALKTNPPSEQLEITCAGLWIGQQNKKFVEKNK